jgi:hypothetical protein
VGQDKSYNILIDRFKYFATGHYLIRKFSHGPLESADINQTGEYPYMHVEPQPVTFSTGVLQFTFRVYFMDIPRDAENPQEYRREALSDCLRLCGDIIYEIQNGQQVFGDQVQVLGDTTARPLINEQFNWLTGWYIDLVLQVPNTWDACDIPADWNLFDPTDADGGSTNSGFLRTIAVSGQDDVIADEPADTFTFAGVGVTITTDATTKTITFTAGSSSIVWGAITGTLSNQTDLQNALNAKQPLDSDLTAIAGLAPSNDDSIWRVAGAWVNRTVAQAKAILNYVKADIGLGNVDNTSDLNKPISTATQAALDTKDPWAGGIAATEAAANTYTATWGITFSGYLLGMRFLVKFPTANTGAATLNINAQGAGAIVRGSDNQALNSGDIQANEWYWLVWDAPENHWHCLEAGYTISNGAIVSATKTKITYDTKGLVTAGADATTADISESGNLYFTDERAQDAVGGMVDSTLVYVDGTPVLKRAPITGDVGVPDGSNTATIQPGVVTEAMQVLADNTTQDVSTSKHGYAPKAPNRVYYKLDGLGSYSAEEWQFFRMCNILGSTVIAGFPGLHPHLISTTFTLVDASLRFSMVYVPRSMTISKVIWWQAVQGNYTADNNNRIGLYSVSAGALTLVASCANDGNLWKGTANSWQTKTFTTPYAASEGVYFIGILYNNSAQVTAPTIGAIGNATNAGVTTLDFSNSVKINSTLAAQTDLVAGPQASSGLTTSNVHPFFLLQ